MRLRFWKRDKDHLPASPELALQLRQAITTYVQKTGRTYLVVDGRCYRVGDLPVPVVNDTYFTVATLDGSEKHSGRYRDIIQVGRDGRSRIKKEMDLSVEFDNPGRTSFKQLPTGFATAMLLVARQS